MRRAEKSITLVDVDNKKFNCDITGYETALWHMEDALKGANKHKIKVDMIIGNNDLCAYQCKVDLKNGYLLIQDNL